MKPNPTHRLPAALEAAVQRLKLAANQAAERSIESLGLAALAATSAHQRDRLLGAQADLRRRSALFARTFNDSYDHQVQRELAAAAGTAAGAGPVAAGLGAAQQRPAGATDSPATDSPATDWASLRLVEDQAMQDEIEAERFGMAIGVACEWEMRELQAYVGSLLVDAGGGRDRNPLRPALLGHALVKATAVVCDRDDERRVLAGELARSLTALLRSAYADTVALLRNAGVQPASLSVRRSGAHGSADDSASATLGRSSFDTPTTATGPAAGAGRDMRFASSTRGHSQRGTDPGAAAAPAGADFGTLDPQLLTLIRRLHAGDAALAGSPAGAAAARASNGQPLDAVDSAAQGLPPNLIRAHRDELRLAAEGALDHLVIDLIGFMFDQILADPKVPPQLARQFARLQLPVLRVALGDKTFFSSRRHPVRRFIDRIASLGAAFDDFDDLAARAFLAQVRTLVQAVVDGDFDRIGLYEQQLDALEALVREPAVAQAPAAQAAATLLAEKEDQQRLRTLYAERLAGELKDLESPPFLRQFLAGIWSQVLLRAAENGGADSPQSMRLRLVASALFLSVQPKPTPAHRKAFLAELPRLMQMLTEGLDLIAWPQAERQTFFAQLMPAHAEALKSLPTRALDINLMARRVESAVQRPLPSKAELPAWSTQAQPGQPPAPPPLLSEAEAQQVGLLSDAAVDWQTPVDLAPDLPLDLPPDLPPDRELELEIEAVAGAATAAGATAARTGAELAEHLEVGYPYQMHLEQRWCKVRLTHISAGRNFFIFSHGPQQRSTVSLTRRMLLKLCAGGRLKAFEASELVERATARARRQLAALSPPPGAAAGRSASR